MNQRTSGIGPAPMRSAGAGARGLAERLELPEALRVELEGDERALHDCLAAAILREKENSAGRGAERSSAATTTPTARTAGAASLQAAALLGPLLHADRHPDRGAAERIAPWIGAMSPVWLRHATRLTLAHDTCRKAMREDALAGTSGNGERHLPALADITLAAARSYLLATTGDDAWRHRMVVDRPAASWTPTLPLLRRRNMYGAAVDRYGAPLLDPAEPFLQFDAAFGLASIAIADPAQRERVDGMLRTLLEGGAADGDGDAPGPHIAKAALWVIEQPVAASQTAAEALGLDDEAKGLVTKAMLTAYPGDFELMGGLAGLAVIPIALAADLTDFFPEGGSYSGGSWFTV